jgi:hypothetical protein
MIVLGALESVNLIGCKFPEPLLTEISENQKSPI